MILTAACLVPIAACQSAPPPDKMARTEMQTAPADLQLLCANAAAAPSGVDASKILPVSSSRTDAENYSVQLDAAGKKFACVVDVNGSVKSVVPA
nr:hypothetical protein [Rhizobium setariae]